MAKNWTVSEAIGKIKEMDVSSVQDIGKRFPLFTTLAAKAVASSGDAVVDLLRAFPEHVTVGKIEKILKADVVDVDETDETDETEDAEVKEVAEAEEEPKAKRGRGRKKAEPKPEPENSSDDEDGSYESMTAMELYKECKKRGIKAEPKQKPATYIKLLKADDAKNSDANDDDSWDDEDEVEEKKPAKKSSTKTEKKSTKKAEVADDDDDDWDI